MGSTPVNTTRIALSTEQRAALAKALNLDANLIPTELGVVNVSKATVQQLGRSPRQVTFSPVLLEV